MKVYISGKITGKSLAQCQQDFSKAELLLLTNGYGVVNPLKLPHGPVSHWRDYMKTDLVALLDCDGIYMLEDWIESPGARAEFALAVEAGMKVFFANARAEKTLLYRIETKGAYLKPRRIHLVRPVIDHNNKLVGVDVEPGPGKRTLIEQMKSLF